MKIIKEHFLNYEDTYIFQDKESFSYGLDAVLLANYVEIHNGAKILDLASGNIPIPLILHKKYGVKVDCLEKQKVSCDLAEKTIEVNGLDKYISVYNMDIRDVFDRFKPNYYNVITINPPYFEDDKNNLSLSKTMARHNIDINLDEILTSVNYLLNNRGHFYMINRVENFFDIVEKLKNKNLIPKRVSFVYPNRNKKCKLFLVDCIKNGNLRGLVIDKPIIIYEDNKNFSSKIIEMLGEKNDTKEF